MERKKPQDAVTLCRQFMNDYEKNFEGDLLMAMTGQIDGVFKGHNVRITYSKDYCLVTMAKENVELLEELVTVLTNYMGGEMPICRYEMEEGSLTGEKAMPTVEWDSVNPEGRIREIVNGRAFEHATVKNIVLYGDRSLSAYVETKEQKEERKRNAKIYGIYPGSIKDPEKIAQLSEVELYFMIDALQQHIRYCNHAASHGRMEPVDLTEEKYAVEYLAYQTTRFGVQLASPEMDKHIVVTPSYAAWVTFYSNHFKQGLTDNEWKEFQRRRSTGEDVSMFMPKGDWHDLIPQFEEKVKG